MSGQFTWFDIMTTDTKAAVAFYTKNLGWTTEDWKGPFPYTMFSFDGQMLGGAMALPDEAKKMGAPPHWLGYVSVDDLDKSLKKAASLEARQYGDAMEIPETGRMAVLADPQGATFAMFQSFREPTGDGSVKALSWTELMSSDPDGAFSFYSQMFGWKKMDSMDMGNGMGTYQMFGLDKQIGGMMKKNPQMPVSAWMYYFKVDDADARFAQCLKNGAKEIYKPMDVPGGDRAAALIDPQGAAFGMVTNKG